MVKKQLFYLLYIFLQFYFTSLREKEPEPEPIEKKYQEPEPEALGKKIRSRSRLKKVKS